jgi:hypothetical protein
MGRLSAMTDAPRKITLMGEALARATEKIAQTKQSRTVLVEDPPIRVAIKDRLLEDRKIYEGMADEDLTFELSSLETNIENIRIELRLDQEGETQRERGWRPRAERAVSVLKGKANLCRLEITQRRKYDSEQQRVEAERRRAEEERRKEEKRLAHEEFLRQGEARKLARQQQANAIEPRARTRAFVRNAEKILSKETLDAIWAAVDAEDWQ